MLKQILCSATLLCVTGLSSAAVIVQEFTVERQKTDFTETVSYNLFNDMGGTRVLDSVEFTLISRTSGTVKVENNGANPDPIEAILSTNISLIDNINMNAILLSATPSNSYSVTLAAFDNLFDYSGDSGRTVDLLGTADSESITITNIATLMTYIGSGTATVDFVADADSTISGGGNLTTNFSTSASGDIKIVYTYTDVATSVAEPTQLALLGLGLVGLFGFRKTKK